MELCVDSVSHILDASGEALAVLKPKHDDFHIAAASRGFCEQTGYGHSELLAARLELLLQGLPTTMLSKSEQVRQQAFFEDARKQEVEVLPDLDIIQHCCRKDGSIFLRMLVAKACIVDDPRRCFILCSQLSLPEGRVTTEARRELHERARATLRQTAELLFGRSSLKNSQLAKPTAASSFYRERIQQNTLLQNNCSTVVRREATQLPRGCMVFGDCPLRPTLRGLEFRLRVNEVTESFKGLPLLGFTRKRPCDEADLYPSVAKCLGNSVFVGGFGEAYARDKEDNFTLGFKAPSQDEIESWSLQPGVALHKQSELVSLCAGDTLGCCYTWDGQLQMTHNHKVIMDFDLGRPPKKETEHYAVIDVSFSAVSLTFLADCSAEEHRRKPDNPDKVGDSDEEEKAVYLEPTNVTDFTDSTCLESDVEPFEIQQELSPEILLRDDDEDEEWHQELHVMSHSCSLGHVAHRAKESRRGIGLIGGTGLAALTAAACGLTLVGLAYYRLFEPRQRRSSSLMH
eukprot:TRINITY_DN26684_c0_g1_i1.p1 TRINITY_DN26684_c0_g1~~TRINITY_DN26684_c0_g1_i1.p1  ORF type:complete len:529 (-),score=78.08 TRINITY_DN26684_c0_g1_i1:209-1753(-)